MRDPEVCMVKFVQCTRKVGADNPLELARQAHPDTFASASPRKSEGLLRGGLSPGIGPAGDGSARSGSIHAAPTGVEGHRRSQMEEGPMMALTTWQRPDS